VNAVPALGAQVPQRGSRVGRAFGRSMLRLMRWRIEGDIPDLPRFVVAVAPHTSNWDFVVGVAAMFALDLRIAFIGKHTLFRWPFDGALRWIGGIPVDRSSPHGVVAASVEAFAHCERRVLAIAPEGTRRQVQRFRTGFLHIARGAGVPVLLAALDWGDRCVRFGPLIQPGDDVEADRERVERHFARIEGKNRRDASGMRHEA
jgi:1-acyl-sn-glycerol-3-phosphate acyltransferase